MLEIILNAFYLLLPAYAANMAPVVFRSIRFLDIPLDFGRKVWGKPIFGPHKTYRGLFFGVVSAIFIAGIQYILPFENVLLDYSNWIMIGTLMGVGAISGDAIKSFFKRRVGIRPGRPWIPFDQIDFVIGALVLISVLTLPGWEITVVAIILSFVLHILINHIAFFLGIRKERW